MINVILALLPGTLHRGIRRMLGQEVSRHAQIGWGALIQVDNLKVDAGARIGSLTKIRGLSATLDAHSRVSSLVNITANKITLSAHSSIAPMTMIWGDPSAARCSFSLGAHSRVFSFCWLEPGHGITIGDRVGVGGHGLIFTHGSWANYFLGAPISFGPVHIQDRVWLPWRVFVMPNVTIGAGAIVGAGSVITRDIPEASLAAGMPAKVLREFAYESLTNEVRLERLEQVRQILLIEMQLHPDTLVVHNAPEGASPGKRGGVVLSLGMEPEVVDNYLRHGVSVLDVVRESLVVADDPKIGRLVARRLTKYGVRVDELEHM
jgi:carbonic anhydrase/acetyltransferase-like protein (isoleucine patch superfamily)